MSNSVLVFDSGSGGLTVAAEIRKKMPNVQLSYVSDGGFFPYGKKPHDLLKQRILNVVSAASELTQPDIIVIACNTASTIALDLLRAKLNVPIVGVVPAIKPAAALTKTGVVMVLGTHTTVNSAYVKQLIADFATGCRVLIEDSEALVLASEQKLISDPFDAQNVTQEMQRIFAQDAACETDVLVLACTHFPLLNDEIKHAIPSHVNVIDSGLAIANRVNTLLKMECKLDEKAKTREVTFYTTGELNSSEVKQRNIELLLDCSLTQRHLSI
ncbi:glutamate racemase [Pseudoalteromonas xiamenensis]|uniref:glutamate racemase n=1 Tax=Pseudoalteromonas xiamenensis TaxID=882626 RepID=UPI0027E4404D|nr:glutamate racemase [Pseudoalteromonas xiamenensis]WMN61382.1 glutamate racemase [Pseudoalteromonas xiamenensis]